MEYIVKRKQQEIDDVLNWAAGGTEEGSRYPGMSYEQGIEAMAHWLFGDTDARPDE